VGKEKDNTGPDRNGPSDGEVVEEGSGAGQSVAELQERYLRLVAEFDNFRKRTEREMTEFKRRAADDVLLALLEVVDNLDRALETSSGGEPSDLREGVNAIRAQMGAILQREGIEPIEACGQAFDPFEMEAVMRMPSDEAAEGEVVRELQKGYRGRGYVLRPSKVIVSAGRQQPEVPQGADAKVPQDKDDIKVRR
jgi:molecular chaperone GrpE